MRKAWLASVVIGLLVGFPAIGMAEEVEEADFWPTPVSQEEVEVAQDSIMLPSEEEEAQDYAEFMEDEEVAQETPVAVVENTEKSSSVADDEDSSAVEPEVIELSEPRIVGIKKEKTEDEGSWQDYVKDRFTFSSYGRVQPSIQPATGETGRQTRIVYPAPRVDEASYMELGFAYIPYRSDDGVEVEFKSSLAFGGEKLFHFDGDFEAKIAVRNLYIEARNLFLDGSVLWVGSRMYRGDDMHLLDFWPLDNLNTYGGGVGWHGASRTNVDLHFGVNRLNNEYQHQVVDVINERFVGEQEVVFLDRQRFIGSLKVEQSFGGSDSIPLFKVKGYGEFHSLRKGEFLLTQPEVVKELPSDNGWLVGAQFSASQFLGDSFIHLFLRYAEGLAAYGEMSIPFGLDSDMRAASAKQFFAGLSGGLDFKYVGLIFAAYMRYFADADGIVEDFDDGWEGVWDIRLTGFVGKYFTPSIEVSQQLRRPNGLSPVTNTQDLGSVFKLSLLPGVRFGKGLMARPEFRLNYTISFLNEAAQNYFAPRDRLRSRSIEHFLGFAAEWWFNM